MGLKVSWSRSEITSPPPSNQGRDQVKTEYFGFGDRDETKNGLETGLESKSGLEYYNTTLCINIYFLTICWSRSLVYFQYTE